jgi:hypothetical protein
LSVKQSNAIDLLIVGKTDREVAESVGVTRQTVCGWRHYSPAFQSELNRRRKAAWGSAADRLRSMLPTALDVVGEALADGTEPNRLRAALKMLELGGLDGSTCGPSAIGPEEVYEVVDAEARRLLHGVLEGRVPISDKEREYVYRLWQGLQQAGGPEEDSS